MQVLIALLLGLVFGLGLILAGMTNPAKVLAFLDVTGVWDPSLALVMLGAVSVSAIGFWRTGTASCSSLGLPLHRPQARRVDRRLCIGSLLFGIGWGLAGLCPGPALVMASQSQSVLIFLLAMLAGMGLFEGLKRTALL